MRATESLHTRDQQEPCNSFCNGPSIGLFDAGMPQSPYDPGRNTSFVAILRWIFFFGVLTVSSCYYDNVPELYPNGCNAIDVSYSLKIVPILDANCLNCHSERVQQGGLTLEGYENIIRYVENGRLMGSIQHQEGFVAMPLTGGQLSSCQIKKFQAWIDAGALDN
jgi:hypothetical protein